VSDVWIRSHDGTLLVPAREITALNVVGTALEARVASMGVVVLAEGPAEELADAAHSLMGGIDQLGEGAFTVTASRHPAGGIGWHATAVDGSGGAGWSAASSGNIDKEKWEGS
jgi:hypothetical protein